MDDVASFSAKASSRPGFARALKTLMMGIEGRSSYDSFADTLVPPRQFSGFHVLSIAAFDRREASSAGLLKAAQYASLLRPTGEDSMDAIRALAVGLAGWLLAAPAAAQTAYPDRPIRFIVGFTPGSATDITARLFARSEERRGGKERRLSGE